MNESNLYITVAYELYTNDNNGKETMVEKAPEDKPFQFISGMGATLEYFEKKIVALKKDDAFDFTIPTAEAYGDHEEARVINLDRKMFEVNDHFDKEHIYVGAVVPLVNSDGNRFSGLVKEVLDNEIIMDLNHPLSGKNLHFIGEVTESRTATKEEIQGMLNMLSGDGGCDGGCDDHNEGCNCEKHNEK